MKIRILVLATLAVLSACRKPPTLGEVLIQADKNDLRIEAITKSGIQMCMDEISSAGIVLREPDTCSSSSFASESELSKLTGFGVRYVAFYHENGKFAGMIMTVIRNSSCIEALTILPVSESRATIFRWHLKGKGSTHSIVNRVCNRLGELTMVAKKVIYVLR